VFIRSAPVDGGAISIEQVGGDSAAELGSLLRAAPRAELDLPCRSGDADLWFSEAPAELERAKAQCARCPIQAECLTGALRRGEPWGVWGGEILERGAVVPRKRPRGRPSKADLARDRAYAEAMSA
jgi:WhiB family transcriptional regulator, redox-sensing transcriptional regulator